jgi:hypothetical protein
MSVLDNLVAWYRGYDATDSTGSYNGVFYNSATSSQAGDTQCGSYWSFPSNGSTVELTPSRIPLNTTDGFTFSSWVYTPYSGSSNTFLLQGPQHRPWAVAGSTGDVSFLQDCFGLQNQTTGWSMTSAMSAGTWYHIAVTATGSVSSHVATFYLNGAQVATASLSTGVCQPINFNAQYIGSGDPSAGNPPTFKRMTDVGFWSRVLSPAEIATVAAGCLVNSTSSQTLVSQFASLVHNVGGDSYLSNTFGSVVHDAAKESAISNTFATVAIELPAISASVPDITGTVAVSASFDGSSSIRPDFYNWSWVSVPGGSTIANAPIPFPDNGASTPIDMTGNLGLYHFETTGVTTPDSSGGGRNLTVNGATQVAGKVGDYSLEFDGSNDYLNYSSVDVLPGTTNAISIALWQYGGTGANNSLIWAENALGQRVINIHLPFGSDVYFDCGNTGGSYDRINKAAAASDYTGKWAHWVFTKNVATGIMKMYRNGQLFDSDTGKTRTLDVITNLYFASEAGSSLFYDGKLDEIAIWNREISESDVSQIFTAQSGAIAALGSSTYTFLPDVIGTYQVNLTVGSTASSPPYAALSSSADATISSAPTPPPTGSIITGSGDELLVTSKYGLQYSKKASEQRFRRVAQIPFSLSSKSFLSIRKKSDDEF